MSAQNREEIEAEKSQLRPYDIALLRCFLIRYPEYGQQWPLDIKFSQSFVTDVLECPHTSSSLKEIISIMDSGDSSYAYIEAMEMWFTPVKIGYPLPEEYPDSLPSACVEKRAKLGIIANTLATLQMILSGSCRRQGYMTYIDDIFQAFQDPRKLDSVSPVAVFSFAAIRNELIIPLFGSVKNFYETFTELRQLSMGYIEGIKSLRYEKLSEDNVRKLFPPDDTFQKFVTLQVSIQPHIDDLIHIVTMAMINEAFVPKKGINPSNDESSDDSVYEFVLGTTDEFINYY